MILWLLSAVCDGYYGTHKITVNNGIICCVLFINVDQLHVRWFLDCGCGIIFGHSLANI